jgi:hypothetical protein
MPLLLSLVVILIAIVVVELVVMGKQRGEEGKEGRRHCPPLLHPTRTNPCPCPRPFQGIEKAAL